MGWDLNCSYMIIKYISRYFCEKYYLANYVKEVHFDKNSYKHLKLLNHNEVPRESRDLLLPKNF